MSCNHFLCCGKGLKFTVAQWTCPNRCSKALKLLCAIKAQVLHNHLQPLKGNILMKIGFYINRNKPKMEMVTKYSCQLLLYLQEVTRADGFIYLIWQKFHTGCPSWYNPTQGFMSPPCLQPEIVYVLGKCVNHYITKSQRTSLKALQQKLENCIIVLLVLISVLLSLIWLFGSTLNCRNFRWGGECKGEHQWKQGGKKVTIFFI